MASLGLGARAIRIAVLTTALAGGGTALAAEPSVARYYSKTFNDCMVAAGGSTPPTRDCLAAEHVAWDKALNAAFRARMTSRSATEQTSLRDEERAWLRRERRRCDHAGDDEAGGSLQGVEIDQCYLDATIRRTLDLRGPR